MQKKLKSLLPSLKEKKRYLVFELIAKNSVKNAHEELTKQLNSLLGIYDSSDAAIMPVLYNEKSNKGILKISNKSKDKVFGAMAFIKEINKETLIVKPIYLTGILDKAKQKT